MAVPCAGNRIKFNNFCALVLRTIPKICGLTRIPDNAETVLEALTGGLRTPAASPNRNAALNSTPGHGRGGLAEYKEKMRKSAGLGLVLGPCAQPRAGPRGVAPCYSPLGAVLTLLESQA